jgi:SAM-dependent methyltransferase
MTTVDSPSTFADAYASFFGPAIFEPLAEVSVRFARPRPGERALDVACGTGILTRRLATAVGPGGHVDGVDINPDMITTATHTPAPPGASIEYCVGDAVTTPPPNPPYDLVSCQQGLQFMVDRVAAARQMRRALAPGARAVLTCWRGLDEHPFYAAVLQAELPHLAGLADVTEADLAAPFSLGAPDRLAAVLQDAGLTVDEMVTEEIAAVFPRANLVRRIEQAYAAVVPAFAADPDAFEAYLDAIDQATRPVVEAHRVGDQVVVPMRALVAVARN